MTTRALPFRCASGLRLLAHFDHSVFDALSASDDEASHHFFPIFRRQTIVIKQELEQRVVDINSRDGRAATSHIRCRT